MDLQAIFSQIPNLRNATDIDLLRDCLLIIVQLLRGARSHREVILVRAPPSRMFEQLLNFLAPSDQTTEDEFMAIRMQ